jgi:plastocyanin
MSRRPHPAASTSPARPWRLRQLVLAVAAVALVGVAACDGSQDQPATATSPTEGVVQVVGTDDLRFQPASLEVVVGTEVELACEPAVNHNLVIVETGQEVAVCPPGGTDRGMLDLEPGDYTFLCTVPGHSATMRGALTVTERVEAG